MKKDFKNTEIETIHTEYYKNGNIKKIIPYNNDNKINGCLKIYFSNGKLKAEINYKKGLRDGYSINYDKNGEIQFKEFFKNGRLKDFYQNDGIWSFNKFGEVETKKGSIRVQSRELTNDEKNLWNPDNILNFFVTNFEGSKYVAIMYNEIVENEPQIIEQTTKYVKNRLKKYANVENCYIVENDEFLEKLWELEVFDDIPCELYQDFFLLLQEVLNLKEKYGIKKAIIKNYV